MIIENPYTNVLPLVKRPPSDRPMADLPPAQRAEREARAWESLQSVVAGFYALVAAHEWHEEVIDTTDRPIPHKLGRKPTGVFVLRRDANQIEYANHEQWTPNKIVLKVAAGSMRIVFGIITLLVALALPVGAAECAQYGYAQKQPVRFWLCATGSDTTTGASEGDYRYNKDTDALQTFDGSAWTTVGGGGGGAPTTATYITSTPDATLVNEVAMSLLGTGLELNTTGTGAQSIYAGTSCTNQFPRSLSASGAAACATVVLGTDTSGSYAAGTGVAGAATTGDSATAFFSAGAIEAARGGTGTDSSASVGVARVSAGSWTFDGGISHLASSTSAQLRTVLSDEIGTGAAMFGLISTMADDLSCTGSQVVRRNAGDTAFECATPSSGGVNAVEVSINLGSAGGLVYTTTVTGQAWVTASSSISCTPLAVSTDGLTVETVYAAGVSVVASNRVAGTGFDMTVYSPHGATGTMRFMCLGA